MSSQSARSNIKKTLEGLQYVVSMGYVPTKIQVNCADFKAFVKILQEEW